MSVYVKDEPVDNDTDLDSLKSSHPVEIINWDDVLDRTEPIADTNGMVAVNNAKAQPRQQSTAPPHQYHHHRPQLLEPKKEDSDDMQLINDMEFMINASSNEAKYADSMMIDYGSGNGDPFYEREMMNAIAASGAHRVVHTNEKKKLHEPPATGPPLPPRPLGYNIRIISSEGEDHNNYSGDIIAPCTTTAILTSAVRKCGILLRDIFSHAGEPLVGQYMYIACTESQLCQDVIYWWFHDNILDESIWMSIVQDPRESVAGLSRFAIVCYLAIISKYSKKLTKREADIAQAIMAYCFVYERVPLATAAGVNGMLGLDADPLAYSAYAMGTNDAGVPLLPPTMAADEHHQHQHSVAKALHFNAIPDANSTPSSYCTTIVQRCGDNDLSSATVIDLTADVVYETLFCIIKKLLDYQSHTFTNLKISDGSIWAYQFADNLPNGSRIDRTVNLVAPRDGCFEMFNLPSYILHQRSRAQLPTDKASRVKRELTILDCLPYRFKLHAIQYIHQINTDVLGGITIKTEKGSGSSSDGSRSNNSKRRESKPRLAKLAGGGKVSVKREESSSKEASAANAGDDNKRDKSPSYKKKVKNEEKKKKKEEGADKPSATSGIKKDPSKVKTKNKPSATTTSTTSEYATPSTPAVNTKKRKVSSEQRAGSKLQPKQKRVKLELQQTPPPPPPPPTWQQPSADGCMHTKGCSYSYYKHIPHSSNCSIHVQTTQSPTEFLRSSRNGDQLSPTYPGEDMDGDEMFNQMTAPALGNDDSYGILTLPSPPTQQQQHEPFPPIASDSEDHQHSHHSSLVDDGDEEMDNSDSDSDDEDDEDEEEGCEEDRENESEFKICQYCSKRYKRAPRHGACECGNTCKSQKSKSKDKAKRVLQPHYQFNESSSLGFRDFLSRVLRLSVNDVNFQEACDYIINKGRVKNIAMESCFGCRTGTRFCCECILLGKIDPGHIFIGLMRADNNGNLKIRIAYICSAKCLQLIRAGSGGLNTLSKHHSGGFQSLIKSEDSNSSRDTTFSQMTDGATGSSSALLGGRIVQRYYYPDGRPGNSAKSRDVFHIEHDELPNTIVKFNLRNAAKLL